MVFIKVSKAVFEIETNTHPDNESRVFCQYRTLEVESRVQANSGIAHRFACSKNIYIYEVRGLFGYVETD